MLAAYIDSKEQGTAAASGCLQTVTVKNREQQKLQAVCRQ